MDWLEVPEWKPYRWLRHGFSTRSGGETCCYGMPGELNLGLTPEDRAETVLRNRASMTETIGGPQYRLATVRQVHGTEVLRADAGGAAGEADGLVTTARGLLLGVLAADCVPILLVDIRRQAVGAFHAGWRGTAAGMAGIAVGRMIADGAHPDDLRAAVGPSIGPCCYQVGEQVRSAFGDAGVSQGDCLNLWETNRSQLVQAGLRPAQISVLAECTVCSQRAGGGRKYFSHRAEAGRTGRMMGVIGLALPVAD